MLAWGNSKFILEAVAPDFSHVIPVGYDTVLDGVTNLEDTLLGESLLSNIDLFVVHSHHNVLILWATND